MKQNVGYTDKIIRMLVGLAIMGAGVYYQSWWGLIGIVPAFTALSGWCPAYSLLGVCTREECRKGTAKV